MARPKLGSGQTERVQLVITDEELSTIETWRYRRRVPSKSEAIRRLCQIGLAYDRGGTDLQRRSERALRATLMMLKEIGQDAPKGLRGGLVAILQEQVAANRSAVSTLVAASVLEDGSDTRAVDQLMAEAEEWVRKLGGEDQQ
jgi:hypothetical protein